MLRTSFYWYSLLVWGLALIAKGDEDYYDQEDCSIDTIGENYQGKIAKTESGYNCQKWNANYPQDRTDDRINILKHLNIDINDWDHNYCRNPAGKAERPLCYTTNDQIRWDYCDVPICNTNVDMLPSIIGNLNDRDGNSQEPRAGESASDRVQISLVRQISPTPAPVNIDERLVINNNNNFNTRKTNENTNTESRQTSGRAATPVSVDSLDKDLSTEEVMDLFNYSDEPASPKIEPIQLKDCYKKADKGQTYEGISSKSRSGRACQYWSSDSPMKLTGFALHFRRKYNVDIRGYPTNQCRNPGGFFRKPICITGAGEKKYEFCKVEECDEEQLRARELLAQENQAGGSNDRSSTWLTNQNRIVAAESRDAPESCGQINAQTDCYKGDLKNSCFKPSKKKTHYLMCTGMGTTVPQSCPEYLYWNHAVLACDWSFLPLQ